MPFADVMKGGGCNAVGKTRLRSVDDSLLQLQQLLMGWTDGSRAIVHTIHSAVGDQFSADGRTEGRRRGITTEVIKNRSIAYIPDHDDTG